MTRQNIAIMVAIAVLGVAAGYWLAAPGKVITPDPGKNSAVQGSGEGVQVVSIRDTASSRLYRVTGEYPQFDGASSAFNAAVAHFITSNLGQFKIDAAANQKAREATMPAGSKDTLPPQSFYFTVQWQPEQVNEAFVSIVTRIEYYDGGANETQLLQTFNYDMAQKKTMTLAGLFPNVQNLLQKVAALSREVLTSSLNNSSNGKVSIDILDEGTTPTAEHYANFTFNDDVVNIYFPKYQVAPGVFGEQKAVIVRSTIR
jgi:hypothetical protein